MGGLQREHIARGLRGHVGVAVTVTADPAPERQGAGVRRQLDPAVGQLVPQLVEDVGYGGGREPLEVVDDVARLVDGLGRLDADLVGAPEQLDGLLQPPGPSSILRLLQQRRHPAQLVDGRPTGDLGRMGGEHRTDRDVPKPLSDVVDVDTGLLDAREGLLEPAALRLTPPQEGPAPVDLLGDVGQVEVGGEGPDQPDGGLQVELGQILETVALRVGPHLLHQVEEVLALGAHQRLAEDRRDQPDVLAQGGVRGTGRVRCSRHVHPCVSLATASPPASTVGGQSTAPRLAQTPAEPQ